MSTSGADGDIDPLLDQVDAAAGDGQLDPQARIPLEKAGQFERQDAVGAHRAADADEALRLGLQPPNHVLDRLRLGQGRARMPIDVTADVGDAEAAGRAFQQPHTQPRLQRRHAPADPRLRHGERARGGRKALVGDHGGEEVEVVEIVHDRRSFSQRNDPSRAQGLTKTPSQT
jgi:hypothetical protein